MEIKALDKGSHTPLYLQLAKQIIGQIQSGELKPGDKLPSERELAENLNVSRITARQAIESLLEGGLIYREQGRGSFIAERKMHGIQGFSSFTDDQRSRGVTPGSKVVRMELIQPDEELCKQLKIKVGDSAIHLTRIRMADDDPMALQTTYIPHSICPGLEEEDLNNRSLFRLLREEYFIHPAWTEAEVRALLPTKEEAELLNIGLDEPVLVVDGVTYTDSFDLVEVVRTVYHGKAIALYMGRQRIGA